MATTKTTSGSVQTSVPATTKESSAKTYDDGNFIYIVMAAVVGTVFLIIVSIILCYILKSRRRRQQNIRIYQERHERPLTVTLAVIDSGDLSEEVGNGVHNSLYNQSDSIIPIAVYDTQAEQDRSSQQHISIHLPEVTESVTNQGESRESESSQKSSSLRRTDTLTSSASMKETSVSPVATGVYENTKVSNNLFLFANDKQKQMSMPNLNDGSKFVGIGRRHNSQKQTKVGGDYETAFPPFGKKKSGNSAKNVDNLDAEIQSVENQTKNRDTDRSHMVKHENRGDAQVRHKSTSSYTEGSDTGSKKVKPEVKPKPKKRGLINKVKTDMSNEQESPNHQSSAEMKRKQQANLNLNAVPPPCNKVTYVNVPQSSSPDSTSGNSQHERSTTNSSSNDKLGFGSFDYVNIPEKKHTDSASTKVCGESREHVNIPDKTASGEMMDGQYVNVPEKKQDISGSEKSKNEEIREYVNVPDKKSSNFELHERKDSDSKDYVNVPDKKPNISMTKGVFDVKTNEKSNVPEKELRKPDEGKTEMDESNCYVNIPENISINVIPEDSRRPLSDYEDPGCIKSLKKDPQDEKIMNERKDHTKRERLNHLKNVTDLKPVYNKAETRRNKRWLQPNLGVPRQAPSAVRGRSISESPTNNELDYENKDAVVELQAALKRKFRRGLSTSSLETSGRYGEWRTGHERAKTQDMSGDDKHPDDGTYLAMDTVQTEEDDYLEMDSPNNSPYVDMKNLVEEEVYVPMTGNNSKTILTKSKTLQPDRNEDIGFGVRTCPRPCGGASGVYDNFSEQPPHYANCFRSKSTNNLNEYSYADTKPVVKLD